MKTYFTCELRNITVNGIKYDNALVVNGIQYGEQQPKLTYLLPEAYIGTDVMGCRYIPEEQRFEKVDPEEEKHEPTQLDRLEEMTLQNAINTEYLVALKEIGL